LFVVVDMTYLRVHSYYSILRGTCSVETLVDKAAAEGLRALALTDEGVLYGAVQFDRACRQANIQPLIGMTLQVSSPLGSNPIASREHPGGTMVVIAANPAGYRSLCQLSSRLMGGGMGPPDPRQPVPWSFLVDHQEGLIVIDAGRTGWVAKTLNQSSASRAGQYLSRFGGAFKDRSYLGMEIPQVQDPDQARGLQSLAARFGVPTVALPPVYSTHKDASDMYRLGAAIERNCRLDEIRPEWMPDGGNKSVDLSWRGMDEIRGAFSDFPAALESIGEIVERCSDSLPAGNPLWPSLSLPDNRTPDQQVAHLAKIGLKQRYAPPEQAQAEDRLRTELAAIARHGFAPFFIVVADIARYAREQDIPISTRGSIANSIVAYCLEITTVDPLEHDLLFERFLNPARTSLPDIDLDFCSRRRDEVLEYVRRTYGEDRVALVGTVSTMRPKSAVRLTAKAYGFPEDELSPILDRLPGGWHPDPRRRDARKLSEILDQFHGRARQIVSSAAGLVGKPHHLSVHPGGVVICPGPATDTVPLQLAPKGFLITQYDHRDVEKIGLPKLDLLGIRALTVFSEALDAVRHKETDFEPGSIVEGDPKTETLLSNGDTIGVFQCESEGARRTLRKLKARSIPDLAVANAFFKPGPATGGMAEAFVRRYRGEEEASYLHPGLEPILRRTKGVLLFQEQILQVATQIAGLEWSQAERLRKGMSKFKPDEMGALQSQFIQGCMRPPPEGPGFSPEQAETLWGQVEAFAGYGFNQGHALAYAGVSYRSAFLKAHFPLEFLAARLANYGGYHHPAVYIAEARRYGFSVRPPQVNYSQRRFSAADMEGEEALFVGLGWVKDLHRSTQAEIVRQRQRRPYDGLRDLLSRVPMMDREIEHLIKAGALDGMGRSRHHLLMELASIQRAGSPLQASFGFFAPSETPPDRPSQTFAWELNLLGMPISVHPLQILRTEVGDVTPLASLDDHQPGPVRAAGARLPGWGGGSRGFLLSDGTAMVQVHLDRRRMRRGQRVTAWTPLIIEGIWKQDSWGGGWLEVERYEILPIEKPKG
jgi:DNA-directed DNA polymerase III PolC